MSLSTAAFVSQTAVFSLASRLLTPAQAPSQAALAPPSAAAKARVWARQGCWTVPILAPFVPSPRSWPLPAAMTVPADLLRSVGIATLGYVSMHIAPPAVCQYSKQELAWGGLQGDCQAQQEAWTHALAQSWDAVSLGLMTGVIVVASFALAGAAVGTAQSARHRLSPDEQLRHA